MIEYQNMHYELKQKANDVITKMYRSQVGTEAAGLHRRKPTGIPFHNLHIYTSISDPGVPRMLD